MNYKKLNFMKKYVNLRNVVAIAICLAGMTMFSGCGSKKTNDNGVYVGQAIEEFIAIFEKQYRIEKEEEIDKVYRIFTYKVYENDEELFSVKDNPYDEDPNKLVGGIEIYSSKFKTEKNIGVGSTLAELNSNYKTLNIGINEQTNEQYQAVYLSDTDNDDDYSALFLMRCKKGKVKAASPEHLSVKSITCKRNDVMITSDKRIIVRNTNK